MRIYTPAGDLAFKTFTFPDGQPHWRLETYEREFNTVTVEVAIKSPSDLFQVVLVSSVLREQGYSEVNLDVRYLMAARMDRAIDTFQPFTLQSVARIINACGFNKVRILDAHSEVATRLIRNSTNVLPHNVVKQILTTVGSVVIICPDEGAKPRVEKLRPFDYNLGYGGKKRDMATGALSGFYYGGPVTIKDRDCLIVDDICDGGGTFTGLAKVLREAGAKKVYLFCTHGIFSKGPYLEYVDKIFTTDSYRGKDDRIETPGGGGKLSDFGVTVIPISLKEIK